MVAEMLRARMLIVASGVLVAVVGVAGWAVAGAWRPGGDRSPEVEVPVSTAVVVRTDVAERRLVSGTLGYAGTFDVLAGRSGTLTWLPAAGQVIQRGQPAFEIDGVKVPLLFGYRPAWRAMSAGMTDGADVEEL